MKPVLYIFSGLPASGKSTLARMLAQQSGACWLRIDTVEQGLRDICGLTGIEGEGYRLSYRIALDNLRLGNSVIADSCNPIQLSRDEWHQVARDADCEHVDIQLRCSSSTEHRYRVESRDASVHGLCLPDWHSVQNREYDDWKSARIQLDTAGYSPEQSFQQLLALLSDYLPDGCKA